MRQFMVLRLQQLCQLEALLEARPIMSVCGELYFSFMTVPLLIPHKLVIFCTGCAGAHPSSLLPAFPVWRSCGAQGKPCAALFQAETR